MKQFLAEYIKREVAERALLERCKETGYGGLTPDDIRLVMRTSWRIPTADVVERKRGEWIRVTEELGESWMCSECMEEFIPHDGMEEFASYAHFCPNCGADMRGAPNGV